jgi:hypothetical protein
VVHDENPYLDPSKLDLLEWLGRKTSKSLTVSDLQEIFQPLLLKPKRKGKKKAQADMEDVGALVRDLLSQTDLDVWSKIMGSSAPLSPTARIVLRSIQEDATGSVAKWETSTFSKSPFAVELVDETIDEEESIRAAEDFWLRTSNKNRRRGTLCGTKGYMVATQFGLHGQTPSKFGATKMLPSRVQMGEKKLRYKRLK